MFVSTMVTETRGKQRMVTSTGGKQQVMTSTGGKQHVVTATGGKEQVMTSTGGKQHVVTATGGKQQVMTSTGGKQHVVTATENKWWPLVAINTLDWWLGTAGDWTGPMVQSCRGCVQMCTARRCYVNGGTNMFHSCSIHICSWCNNYIFFLTTISVLKRASLEWELTFNFQYNYLFCVFLKNITSWLFAFFIVVVGQTSWYFSSLTSAENCLIRVCSGDSWERLFLCLPLPLQYSILFLL